MTNIKTRHGVFETNSSSTHSLTLSPIMENMVESPVTDREIAMGFVTICSGEYGWEQDTFSFFHEKASYLYTDAMIGKDDKDENVDPNNEYYRNTNLKLKMIADSIKEYTGLGVVFTKEEGSYYPFGYIDHQSYGVCSQVWEEGVDGVTRFLFSMNSSFETDNDNR